MADENRNGVTAESSGRSRRSTASNKGWASLLPHKKEQSEAASPRATRGAARETASPASSTLPPRAASPVVQPVHIAPAPTVAAVTKSPAKEKRSPRRTATVPKPLPGEENLEMADEEPYPRPQDIKPPPKRRGRPPKNPAPSPMPHLIAKKPKLDSPKPVITPARLEPNRVFVPRPAVNRAAAGGGTSALVPPHRMPLAVPPKKEPMVEDEEDIEPEEEEEEEEPPPMLSAIPTRSPYAVQKCPATCMKPCCLTESGERVRKGRGSEDPEYKPGGGGRRSRKSGTPNSSASRTRAPYGSKKAERDQIAEQAEKRMWAEGIRRAQPISAAKAVSSAPGASRFQAVGLLPRTAPAMGAAARMGLSAYQQPKVMTLQGGALRTVQARPVAARPPMLTGGGGSGTVNSAVPRVIARTGSAFGSGGGGAGGGPLDAMERSLDAQFAKDRQMGTQRIVTGNSVSEFNNLFDILMMENRRLEIALAQEQDYREAGQDMIFKQQTQIATLQKHLSLALKNSRQLLNQPNAPVSAANRAPAAAAVQQQPQRPPMRATVAEVAAKPEAAHADRPPSSGDSEETTEGEGEMMLQTKKKEENGAGEGEAVGEKKAEGEATAEHAAPNGAQASNPSPVEGESSLPPRLAQQAFPPAQPRVGMTARRMAEGAEDDEAMRAAARHWMHYGDEEGDEHDGEEFEDMYDAEYYVNEEEVEGGY